MNLIITGNLNKLIQFQDKLINLGIKKLSNLNEIEINNFINCICIYNHNEGFEFHIKSQESLDLDIRKKIEVENENEIINFLKN